MAEFKKKRGDHLPMYVDVEVQGLDNTVTGAAGWFTVKRLETDSDDAALIRKSTAAGTMTTEAPKRFKWTINPEDDANLPENLLNAALYWDFQYRGVDGRVKTTDEGSLRIAPDITRTTI